MTNVLKIFIHPVLIINTNPVYVPIINIHIYTNTTIHNMSNSMRTNRNTPSYGVMDSKIQCVRQKKQMNKKRKREKRIIHTTLM